MQRFIIVAAAVVLLFGAPLVLGSALQGTATDYHATETLTVADSAGNTATWQTLGNNSLYGNETVSQNGTTLNESEDYRLNASAGTIDFVTCSEQGVSAGPGCPVEGNEATVDYWYESADQRIRPLAVGIGLLFGAGSDIGLLIAVVAALLAATKVT
ncbi:hypothetical protein [Halorussus pelagicus]|uniref:hypothetical protein n=1 Tax=Halorussus pelagicus TaxID=2505977 RepID=UPI000FFB18F9|nr:hypothetical protein [Halorussus pelagicus]